MKKQFLHSSFLSFWPLLSILLFSVSSMANTTAKNVNCNLFSKTQKIKDFNFFQNTKPVESEFPKKSSNENLDISNNDVEEFVDSFLTKNTINFLNYTLYIPIFFISNYKETGNKQFLPDIVPPPPKK